ncbi:MAG: hypothetical protein IAE84_02980 [Saprospiraceae bacterium]|jgi:hypothetical protein|nr:hypothetical protein [Saprospiraceae bacterium]HRD82994.1 hypothetical protein [Saprospiraceae bacterium]HRJ15047.1 hypothetical protein [Saprospiraceae bacterium]HRK82022.1 hypothetical protein [Saprospiraceae bacterium]
MRFLLPAILWLFLGCSFATAQVNISGQWKGSITQEKGGYRPTYDFEMFLSQKGSTLKGRSYVFVDNIFAVIELSGEVSGNNISIREFRIVDSKKTKDLEWCIKTYKLTYSKSGNTRQLSGSWTGHTNGTPCIPGKIILTRQISRA